MCFWAYPYLIYKIGRAIHYIPHAMWGCHFYPLRTSLEKFPTRKSLYYSVF